ncbi:hypothetical protein [Alteromonas sp. A079]|uniref:hypothetical protein n=1 Tax=Alteromonas sp. A079 TaxID=3410268 RepID=UPI003BA37A10
MKLTYFIFSCLLILSFSTGQYLKERAYLEARISDAQPEIAVTEVLLKDYLASCNKEGYRRFTTFHEHNIDNALRRIANSGGFPYFLGQEMLNKMEEVYQYHKENHESSKANFLTKCDEIWQSTQDNNHRERPS